MAGARIQLKRATAASWASNNPVLYAGEIGLETDTNKFKIFRKFKCRLTS